MSTSTARFWAKVDKSGECWNWTAATNTYGYGVVRDGGKVKKAHRVSFEMQGESIPEGMVIDHICRNPRCVRPAHLRIATTKQNLENLDGAHGHNVNSGVRGVYKTRDNKWQARVTHNGKIYTAGTHHTIQSAEEAVILLRNTLHTHNDADRRE